MKKETIILNALSDIPLIKEGKGGVKELRSFYDDICIFLRFKSYCLNGNDMKIALELWNKFIQMRNDEDFILYTDSENYGFYYNLFR